MGLDSKLKCPDTVDDHIVEQLLSKKWEDLEIIEHAEHLLFPAHIYKRQADKSFKSISVMLRVPRDSDMRAARVEARAIATKEGLDEAKDKDLFDNLEVICILSRAIRSCKSPYEPLEPFPLILEKTYDKACLAQIYGKLDQLASLVDPKPDQISKEEMFALTASLASERNLLPLHVYGALAQTVYIITMADLLMSSPGFKSFCGLSEPLTQES